MKPRRWYFIISVFLSVAFSARAQSPALKAVLYERILFDGAGPSEANDALISRALCLTELARWADASDALDRLRIYALEPSRMQEVNYLKALCKYRLGDYASAAAVMAEGFPDTTEAQKLGVLINAAVSWKGRDEFVSTLLGLAPPFGHIYTKASGAVPTTLATYGSVALWLASAISGDWVTAILGGGLLLSETWWRGSVQAMPQKAREYNTRELANYLEKLEAGL